MKQFAIIALVALVLGCSGADAQGGASTTVTSSIDKRVVGTWVKGKKEWVFNADGTGKVDNEKIQFIFFSNKMVIAEDDGDSWVWDYAFSGDGKTLFLFNGPTGHSGLRETSHWLTKKN